MMNAEKRRTFEELRAQVACDIHVISLDCLMSHQMLGTTPDGLPVRWGTKLCLDLIRSC